jgi:N-acetylglucosamine malate deacetylase 2
MNILAVAAHPDDEMDFAGLLSRFADSGHAVTILFTTRGEGGTTGNPPLCERHELGQVREAESRESGAIIGARDVRFLPFIDPRARDGQMQHVDASLEEFTASIQAVLEELRPDVVITHGSNGEYGHPQHVFTHQAVFSALQNLQSWKPKAVLTGCANYPGEENLEGINKDDPADYRVNIQPWAERKRAAFQAHRTQYPALLKNSEAKGTLLMTEKTECYRSWPEFAQHGEGQDPLFRDY